MIEKYPSQIVTIGNIPLGGGYPIIIQSMTNTNTLDTGATVEQVKRIVAAGGQMVRITVPTMKEVGALQAIRDQLRSEGLSVPLVADVHYHPEVAEACARIVEKVRVNPGNFTDKRNLKQLDLTESEYAESANRMARRAAPLFEICKRHHTTLRIGINHGSLCDRIVSRYGNTPLAMVMSAMEWVDICHENDFRNVVFSMKSSNVHTMIEATLLLAEKMRTAGKCYPLHLGVTEAGAGDEGRAKSAAGIGTLLLSGIGDTIRVSLTENPENEIPAAIILANIREEIKNTEQHIDGHKLTIKYNEPGREKWLIVCAAAAGYAHYHQHITELQLINPFFTADECRYVTEIILQACRIKMTRTEFISCPSCGRTQYDIQDALAKVKSRFSHYPDLKIGVMGCVVNGPGEMADADFGIVGAGSGKVLVYKQKEKITTPITIDDALNVLEQLIHDRKSSSSPF